MKEADQAVPFGERLRGARIHTYDWNCYDTYMSKLTLSVDPAVVSRAKLYARRRGISVSEMVETYLAVVADPPSGATGMTPILRSVRGVLKHADPADYRKHIESKYR
jgi:hypothetical protein